MAMINLFSSIISLKTNKTVALERIMYESNTIILDGIVHMEMMS